jgi:hypothetical protein
MNFLNILRNKRRNISEDNIKIITTQYSRNKQNNKKYKIKIIYLNKWIWIIYM